MKKLLLSGIVLLMFVPLVGQAQKVEKSNWRKNDDHWARPNSLTFTTSVLGWSSYEGVALLPKSLPVLNLEYDRIVYRNLSISAIGFYAKLDSSMVEDAYEMHENFVFAGAKVNYNLPLVRNWLYLRAGIGGGVGIHEAIGFTLGDIGYMPNPPSPVYDTYIKPHIMVDMYLVLRATQWLELRFAPLILSASQFVFGSKFDTPYNNSTYYYRNPWGTLGVSIRF
jgi:hypothetical protein